MPDHPHDHTDDEPTPASQELRDIRQRIAASSAWQTNPAYVPPFVNLAAQSTASGQPPPVDSQREPEDEANVDSRPEAAVITYTIHEECIVCNLIVADTHLSFVIEDQLHFVHPKCFGNASRIFGPLDPAHKTTIAFLMDPAQYDGIAEDIKRLFTETKSLAQENAFVVKLFDNIQKRMRKVEDAGLDTVFDAEAGVYEKLQAFAGSQGEDDQGALTIRQRSQVTRMILQARTVEASSREEGEEPQIYPSRIQAMLRDIATLFAEAGSKGDDIEETNLDVIVLKQEVETLKREMRTRGEGIKELGQLRLEDVARTTYLEDREIEATSSRDQMAKELGWLWELIGQEPEAPDHDELTLNQKVEYTRQQVRDLLEEKAAQAEARRDHEKKIQDLEGGRKGAARDRLSLYEQLTTLIDNSRASLEKTQADRQMFQAMGYDIVRIWDILTQLARQHDIDPNPAEAFIGVDFAEDGEDHLDVMNRRSTRMIQRTDSQEGKVTGLMGGQLQKLEERFKHDLDVMNGRLNQKLDVMNRRITRTIHQMESQEQGKEGGDFSALNEEAVRRGLSLDELSYLQNGIQELETRFNEKLHVMNGRLLNSIRLLESQDEITVASNLETWNSLRELWAAARDWKGELWTAVNAARAEGNSAWDNHIDNHQAQRKEAEKQQGNLNELRDAMHNLELPILTELEPILEDEYFDKRMDRLGRIVEKLTAALDTAGAPIVQQMKAMDEFSENQRQIRNFFDELIPAVAKEAQEEGEEDGEGEA